MSHGPSHSFFAGYACVGKGMSDVVGLTHAHSFSCFAGDKCVAFWAMREGGLSAGAAVDISQPKQSFVGPAWWGGRARKLAFDQVGSRGVTVDV